MGLALGLALDICGNGVSGPPPQRTVTGAVTSSTHAVTASSIGCVVPSPRSKVMMCYDVNTGGAKMAAGITATGPAYPQDTWDLDATNYAAIYEATNPTGKRYDASMDFDLNTNAIVAFGGIDDAGNKLSDTITLEGDPSTDWVTQSPVTVPAARGGHRCAFKPSLGGLNNSVFMWGGENQAGALIQDGYIYFEGNWFAGGSTTPPSARKWHSMTYVAARDLIVLFGGRAITGATSSTYTIGASATTWTVRAPSTPPSARQSHNAAELTGTGMIMFGGNDGLGTLNAETWLLTGAGSTYIWTQLTPTRSPSAREFHGMAKTDIGVLLFGGKDQAGNDLNDLWLYRAGNWTRLA